MKSIIILFFALLCLVAPFAWLVWDCRQVGRQIDNERGQPLPVNDDVSLFEFAFGLAELCVVLFFAWVADLFTRQSPEPKFTESDIERSYGVGYWPEDFR